MAKIYSLICLTLFCVIQLSAQQSINITFQHDGKTVYGTYTVPAGTGPFPTIIIDPGSGPNDRDATLPMVGGTVPCLYPNLLNDTLRPYKELAESLTDSGYAVLRYDKLEYTYGASLGTITFHKLWLPVESAIDFVKTRPETDSTQIILIGHSEGSTFIPYIANGRNDIKALISLAGPRTPFDSVLAYQLVYFTRLCNGDTTTAISQANQVAAYFNLIRTNTWTGSTPAFAGVPASVWYTYTQIGDSVAINYNNAIVPTLFVGLGSDMNVPPSELQRFETDLTRHVDFYSVPGDIHYMCNFTNPHIDAEVPDTIVYWLRHLNASNGINNIGDDAGITVFPNPFNDKVTIQLKDEHSMSSLHVKDITGRVVYQENFNNARGFNKSVPLQNVSSGIYFIEVNTGTEKLTHKIIKQ